MISREQLTADLKKQVKDLEEDLRQRIGLPKFAGPWMQEHADALAGDRTAATYTAWADDRITQAAVSWVLTSVFVRFCEDNRLLSPVWISGPPERRQDALDAQNDYFRNNPEHTDREWLELAIAHLADTPATAGLVDGQAMFHTVSPSGQAVTALLDFCRRRGDDGELIHDFTDPELDTRFLGDLYQDLSDHAKKTYALLQTPEFVEEFILDRTLTPALNDRALDGFKMIDPACGSGHFLLGAFDRLLDRWSREYPALGPRERVQKVLDAVWGVDINPFAAAIARFRLTVAALIASGKDSLEDVPGFTINVLAGDSLWFSHSQDDLFDGREDFAYSNEKRKELVDALTRDQYDAVVANPPYITVKDKALNTGYRERYNYLKGTYALTVPFMELLFKLAKRGASGQPAGWVGQITSNSFMKREFGKPIIEKFLANTDLREVIDTSGAYIPGHGTPTVILVGRNQSPKTGSIRGVLGIRGEPDRPEDPERGLVWSAIRQHVGHEPYQDSWITVTDLERSDLKKHPWNLTGGGSLILNNRIEGSGRLLRKQLSAIGYSGQTNSDGTFLAPKSAFERKGVERELTRRFVIGEEVRDYALSNGEWAVFPYEANGLVDIHDWSHVYRWMWRTKTATWARSTFVDGSYRDAGRTWWEWHQISLVRAKETRTVCWAFVSTHNHFAFVRGEHLFNRSAPFFVLPEGASEDDHLELLGVLNSSTACFWLKQNSHNKGSTVDQRGARQTTVAWENFYEFTGTVLKHFPLPKSLPLERARTLDVLAQELSANQVEALIEHTPPTASLLRSAEDMQSSIRGRMIAHQEELDWEVYHSYGLIDDALVFEGEPPEVSLGERAFEIVLARRIAAGEDQSTWFSRHGSTPITEIPDHWPADYRALVQRRIDAIESIQAIGLLEAPEYKRRWASEPFDKQAERALRGWLLDRLEDRALWFSPQGHPTPRSVSQLADELGRDSELVSVVDLWVGVQDAPLVKALTDLLEPEAVPYLAALRLKASGLRKFAEWQRTWELQRREDAGHHVDKIPVPPKYTTGDFLKQSFWAARGKLDVPKERFIAYPNAGRETDPTLLLGWAGWDHSQQSLALATIINERRGDGAPDSQLVPLVAGMAELQPWVEQWHSEMDPLFGISPTDFCAEQIRGHLLSLGLTRDDLAAWRPPAPTRGRRARR